MEKEFESSVCEFPVKKTTVSNGKLKTNFYTLYESDFLRLESIAKGERQESSLQSNKPF